MQNNIPAELRKSPGVYEIKNLVNGKVYVGSAFMLQRRYTQHLNRLTKGKHENPPLQFAYEKYGVDSFSFGVLEAVEFTTDRMQLNRQLAEVENKYIALNRSMDRTNGYNISSFDRSIHDNLYPDNLKVYFKGEDSSRAKLSRKDVLSIVKLYQNGASMVELSKQFNVSNGTVYHLLTGRNWSSVTGIELHNLGGMPKAEYHHKALLTNEAVYDIVDMIKRGCRNIDIAAKYRVPSHTIKGIKNGSTYASISGLPYTKSTISGRRPTLSDQQILDAKHCLLAGQSIRSTARQLGVSHWKIQHIKDRLDVTK